MTLFRRTIPKSRGRKPSDALRSLCLFFEKLSFYGNSTIREYRLHPRLLKSILAIMDTESLFNDILDRDEKVLWTGNAKTD